MGAYLPCRSPPRKAFLGQILRPGGDGPLGRGLPPATASSSRVASAAPPGATMPRTVVGMPALDASVIAWTEPIESSAPVSALPTRQLGAPAVASKRYLGDGSVRPARYA